MPAAGSSAATPSPRANGCVPLNIIGNNPVDRPPGRTSRRPPARSSAPTQSQDVASANFNGEVWEGWAGPISMATGAEWRREKYDVHGDPYGAGVSPESLGSRLSGRPDPVSTVGNNWYAGNYHNGAGSYNVREAYIEFNLPFLKSDTWGEANLNLADRQTKYSTAGSASSWKIGATWKTPIDGLRLRAVSSKDVRAPNLSELFAAPVVVNNQVQYQGNTGSASRSSSAPSATRPAPGNRAQQFLRHRAEPAELGAGLLDSLDYFDIKVKDVDLHAVDPAGSRPVRGRQPGDLLRRWCSTARATTTSRRRTSTSLRCTREGLRFETAYRKNLDDFSLPGRFTVRALATRTCTSSPIRACRHDPERRRGRQPGQHAEMEGAGHAVLGWRRRQAGLTLTERWFSDGKYSNEYIECQTNCPVSTLIHPTIYDNKMKGATYVDFGGSYNVSKQMMAYFKIDNLADRDPEPAPQANPSFAINPALYDVGGPYLPRRPALQLLRRPSRVEPGFRTAGGRTADADDRVGQGPAAPGVRAWRPWSPP
jgi:iron complex outermembrane receptor protein